MSEPVLSGLLESMDQREPVALLSVTEGTGQFARALGQRCTIWLDERQPVGDLDLGWLTEQAYADARLALAQRKHQSFDYQDDSSGDNARDSVRIFVEVQAQPPHLLIVGAGHIAVPLASIAKINDFRVTVIDDRPQYAHPARFPTADSVLAGPFRETIGSLRPDAYSGQAGDKRPFDQHTYIVLVTRGHQYDIDALLEVLDDPLAYIGMIGSQRRIRAVFQLLESEKGIDPKKFDRVYAPIGIDIGAQTPAEIAVCIMAEVINVYRNGPALSMREQIVRERQRIREQASSRTT